MTEDIIFTPLEFKNLTVKNRLFRSSVSGRFDNYDGSGTQARINWETKFAKGGIGAIISSHVPITIEGRHVPNFATIHSDEQIPFWKQIGKKVHESDCKFILQLNHAGRQRDAGGFENDRRIAMSSTNQSDPFHGFVCRAMTEEEIRTVINQFVEAAKRVREAELDGIELHGANGYLINQFLSSAINDRTDKYGGSVANRARFLVEIVRGIRRELGADFHLQVKINGLDYNNAVIFWKSPGNLIEDTIEICKILESEGVDAIHVSGGSGFPHPKNPPGDVPYDVIKKVYPIIDSGKNTFRNYILARYSLTRPLIKYLWNRTKGDVIEGINLPEAKLVKDNVNIPVLCTGGFQTASFIRQAIEKSECDAVTMARPLIANNDLPKIFANGRDKAEKPCTYCNKCLYHVLEDPIGCYELSRYNDDYEKMTATITSVFHSDEPTN